MHLTHFWLGNRQSWVVAPTWLLAVPATQSRHAVALAVPTQLPALIWIAFNTANLFCCILN